MAFAKYLALLGLVALVAVSATAEVEEEDDVLVLTDKNYKEVIESHPILLVEFYAPWCGHCKSLAPEYAKAAKALKKNDPPIRIAKVDATAEEKLGSKYGVQGFPTLKLFKGSVEPESTKEYDGGRTASDIEAWMKKRSGPACKVVDSQESLDSLIESTEVVVLGILDSLDGEHKAILEKVADSDDSAFAVTTNADIAKKYGKTAPAIVLFKSFDEGRTDFDGKFEKSSIATFVKENSTPLVMTFSQDKASKIFGGSIDVHFLMFSDETKPYHKDLVEGAKVAATENKGKILHILIPLSEDRILDYFGFKEADLPAAVLVNMAKGMKKYPYTSKADELIEELKGSFPEDLKKFESDYFAGNLKANLKSAEPVDDKDDAVKVIVGKEFKSRVIDTEQDVLVEFYAPWCGHCKSLAPKYEELAEKFSGVDSIMIAKMDSTENEIDYPGVDVQGFPTIYFFPGGKKDKPVVFEGDRDVKGFTEFLKKHARSFSLDGETHGRPHDEL